MPVVLRRTLLAVGILVVLAAGCATYTAKLHFLRPQLTDGAYDAALATVEKGTGSKDVLLAFLERGLILHYAGRFAESTEALAAAERTADDLYARSVSEGAVSLITNDMSISYRARPYEMAMVPYYRALNYLALGRRDDAMVEARKTSLMLAGFVDATIKGIERGDTGDLERTRNDPFMLYFSGMLYDWDGELNDAFIAYRNAATAYQDLRGLLGVAPPPSLASDLERVSRRLGFGAELAQLRAACPDVFAASAGAAPKAAAADEGEVVLFLEVGYVPIKDESRLNLPIFKSDSYEDNGDWAWALTSRAGGAYSHEKGRDVAYWLTVAMPTLRHSRSAVRRSCLVGQDGACIRGTLVHNPAATAQITFEAEYPMILFKTVLRGLAKWLASNEADKKGKGWGLLANVLGAATETADTRGWLTLPEHVQLLRTRLPVGTHDLTVELYDASGRSLGAITVPGVEVRAGDWTFVNHRVFDG